jgi:sulfur-oxidizing protein SoxY
MRTSAVLGRLCCVLAIGAGIASGGTLAMAQAVDDPWPGLRKDLFQQREILDEDGAVLLEAPVRADDAALVPLTVRMPAASTGSVKKLYLIIDKNPAPVAATFEFGEAAGNGERLLSTRVRVDMYSNIRAVIETGDGRLHMTAKFVKAAGGCSAPALKDMDQALASIGKMQVRNFDAAGMSTPTREAQVMIRHPNYSGLQMNQLTGLYIPAKFVSELTVKRGSDLVFQMEGGISLSEDPNIRFTYEANGKSALEVTAKDIDGKVFEARGAPEKGS